MICFVLSDTSRNIDLSSIMSLQSLGTECRMCRKFRFFEVKAIKADPFDVDYHHIHKVTHEELRWSLTAGSLMANYSNDDRKSTPNFEAIFFNNEKEFESRCHFYRVQILDTNRNPHSLQLFRPMGGR